MLSRNFYKNQQYRDLVKIALEESSSDRKITYAQAAQSCHVQATYFSNVLKGRADFSEDQVFALCQYLGLNALEADYLMLCHQYERSSIHERKAFLATRISQIKEKALSPPARLDIINQEPPLNEDEVLYQQDPMHHVLAICLGLSPQNKDLDNVRTQLRLSDQKLSSLLEVLQRTHRIHHRKGVFSKVPLRYHITPTSRMLLQHQMNLRMLSLEKMKQLDRSEFKALSATFDCPSDKYAEIQEVLDKCMEEIRSIVQQSQTSQPSQTHSKSVFQVNLDLFPWFMTRKTSSFE